jgi:decaprenylphospho-beta-D-erythro-pentofuranosid-2-ulose 2-reductase
MERSVKRIAIFGATSSIAVEAARVYAAQEAIIVLVGRSAEKLNYIADDLRSRGADVSTVAFELSLLDKLPECIAEVKNTLGEIDCALIAHGVLPKQDEVAEEIAKFHHTVAVNFESPAIIAEQLARIMAEQPSGGTIAVISSVAGDRGRKMNYIYGSSKSALSAYLGGLRNKYGKGKVHVMTIKPGFVATPMTAHLKQGVLFASPKSVGADIVKAIAKRKNVLYTPWYWGLIMIIVKLIPEPIFKRMSL